MAKGKGRVGQVILVPHLCINIRTQFLRIVVVKGDHPLNGHVGVNVAPSVSVVLTGSFDFHHHIMRNVPSSP